MRTLPLIFLGLVTLPTFASTPNPTKTYYGPVSFADMLKRTYSPKLTQSANGITTNLSRYLISNSSTYNTTANYLTIGSNYNATTGYTAQPSSLPRTTNYGNYFSKLIQVVANLSDNSGYYRLDSHLHPNYSIDVDETDSLKLKFRNNRGKTASTYGYVVFSYDALTHLLRAEKRYQYTLTATPKSDPAGKSYNTYLATYTEAINFKGAGYYVASSNGEYKLVPNVTSASKLYFYTASDDYGIPKRFNPNPVRYKSNPAAPFPAKVSPDQLESGNNAFYTKLNSTYRPQVQTAGSNTQTKFYADQFLATIPANLGAQGAHLRYDPELYKAFREVALAGKAASASTSDGTPGQKLVPFVYFTNEKDASGLYHPFMNVVTYTIPGGPQGLLDVPGPPFLGTGDPNTTPVTRFSNLDYSIARIPMKDYGQVTNVTDNKMIPNSDAWRLNLVTDSHCGETNSQIATCPAYDNYNYASIADIGVLIDGSIIFPVLNNALMPSQWKGELSMYGCHVGQGGGGPHCHADAFQTGQSTVTLYNDSDYANKLHPPLIGFGYDGIALFGVYRTDKDQSMLGYSDKLDAFGGHNHDNIGYHYHAHIALLPSSYDVKSNGFNIPGESTPINVLLKGAWAGNINTIPFFGFRDNFANNPYLGGM